MNGDGVFVDHVQTDLRVGRKLLQVMHELGLQLHLARSRRVDQVKNKGDKVARRIRRVLGPVREGAWR